MALPVYQSMGTVGTGTTSVTPGLPASLATGDGVLILVVCKPDTATIVTPTGWTLVANVSGGGGTTGNGTGPSQQAWFFREKDATWTTMPAITVTGGTRAATAAFRYTKTAGTLWDVASSTGVYGVAAATTNASTTLGSNPGLTANDAVIGAFTQQAGTGTIFSAESWTATGITTWGTVTERAETITVSTNPGIGSVVYTGSVTTGTATAAPVMNGTLTVAGRGTAATVRLREVVLTTKSATDTGAVSAADASSKTTIPPLSTQVDTFDTYNTSFWTTGAGGPTINNGRLRLFGMGATAQIYSGLYGFDSFTFELAQAPQSSDASASFWLDATTNTGTITLMNYDEFSGNLYVDGTPAGTYNTTSHRFFRVTRLSNGTASIDAAPDGITWTPLGTTTTTYPTLAGIQFTGSISGVNTVAYGEIDNLNSIPNPPVAKSASDTGAIAVTATVGIVTATPPPQVTQVQQISGTSASGTTTTTATFASPATAGNIIWAAYGGDKNVNSVVPVLTGWNVVFEHESASVSAWFAWREATGGETAITLNHSAATAGSTLWIGEYAQAGTGAWELKGSATNPTAEATTLSWSTGTTSPTTGDGAGVAMVAIDSGQSNTGTPAWSNGYTMLHTWASSGRGDVATGINLSVPSGTAATTTMTYTGTADQMSGAIAVFGRVTTVASTPITATDTTAITIADSSVSGITIFANITATDTTAISVAEVNAFTRNIATVESNSLSIAEVNVNNLSTSTTDSGSVSVNDISNLGSVLPANDSVAVSITDQSQVSVFVSANESNSLSAADASAALKQFGSTDTTAVSVSETNTTAVTQSAVDSASVSIAETDTTASTGTTTDTSALVASESVSTIVYVSVVESNSLSAADASANFNTVVASDTAAVSVNDIAGIGSTLPANDTTAISVADASVVSVVVSTTDTTAVSATDVASTLVTQTRTESNNLAAADASAPFVTQATTDTGSISASDVSATFKNVVATDTTAITVTETNNNFDNLPANESTVLGITEQAVTFVTSTTAESGAVSVAETSAPLVDFSTTDTSRVDIAETTLQLVANNVSVDTAAVSVAETTQVAIFDTRSATDTTAVSVAEARAFGTVAVVANDTTAVSVAEATAGYRNIDVSESASISVSEQAIPFTNFPGQENNLVSVTEQSALVISGQFFPSATDTTAITASEQSNLVSLVATNDGNGLAAADASSLATSGTINLSTTDTGSISTSETVAHFLTIQRSDTSAISESSAVSGNVVASASDQAAVSVSESTAFANTQSASDTSALVVTESAGTFFVAPGQDTPAILVSEASSVTTSGSQSPAASDSVSISVSEVSSVSVTISTSDASSISIADASGFATVARSAVDGNSLVVTESRSIAAALSSTDTGSVSVSETTGFGGVDIAASDGAAVSVSETSALRPALPANDGGSIQASEFSGIIIGGTVPKSAVDGLAVSVSDAPTKDVDLTATDNVSVSVTATVGFGPISFGTTDTEALAVTETSIKGKSVDADDNLNIGLVETYNITTYDSLVVIIVGDVSSLGVGEFSAKYLWGGQFIPIHFETHQTQKSNFALDTEHGTIITITAQSETHFSTSNRSNKTIE